MSFSRILATAATALFAVTAQAVPILHQTAQGNYQSNVLGGSQWTDFTALMTASHTLSSTSDFSNLSQLSSYSAVWVDQELGGTLSLAEINTLTAYASAGHKVVLTGENYAWSAWNTSIMQVVGGSIVDDCSWGVGAALVSNTLTNGVTQVTNACGSRISAAGGAEILFSNEMAALYKVGAGEVLVIADSNWNDNPRLLGNQKFAENIVIWLGESINQVPEPGSMALLGLGLAGLAGVKRRRA